MIPIWPTSWSHCSSDGDHRVQAKAIHRLKNLDSDDSAHLVLQTLQQASNPEVIAACLDFFAKVSVRDDALALSVATTLSALLKANSNDAGVELRITSAVVRQMARAAPIVHALVIAALRSSTDHVRVTPSD